MCQNICRSLDFDMDQVDLVLKAIGKMIDRTTYAIPLNKN